MRSTVTLSPSGHHFTVENSESVLDAAIRQGVSMPYGCRNGQCGACMAEIVEGRIEYHDQPEALEGQPAEKCLPCKGMARGDLTLKVREVEAAAEIEVRMLPCRVNKMEHLAHDVVRLYLKLPDAQRLQFQAGQYLDFMLSDGRRRAFSIANAPHDDEFIELHIRHVDGGEFTDWVFNQMQDKTILRIQAPLGTFTLDEASPRPMLFMAGGTGFAPLKGQIEHAFRIGIERPMKFYWGVRARRDLYLPDLPQAWARERGQFSYTPVLSEPDADWEGRRGWVHDAVLADISDLAGYDVYMAGPPPMVAAARDAFRAAGLPDEQMHYDSFEYAEDTRGKSKD